MVCVWRISWPLPLIVWRSCPLAAEAPSREGMRLSSGHVALVLQCWWGAVGGPGLLGGVVMASHPHYQVRFVTNSHTHTHREDPMFVCVSVIFFSSSLSFDCYQCTSWWPVMLYLHFLLFSSFLLFCPFFFFSSFYSFLPSLALLHYTYIKIPSSNTGMPQIDRTDKDNYITCW